MVSVDISSPYNQFPFTHVLSSMLLNQHVLAQQPVHLLCQLNAPVRVMRYFSPNPLQV